MKKVILVFLSICLFSLFFSCAGKQKTEIAESADIHFFYLELCPGCESYETAERLSKSVLSLGGKALNIIHDEDAQTLKDILNKKNLADISHSLPLLVIGNLYYVGYEEISERVELLEKNKDN